MRWMVVAVVLLAGCPGSGPAPAPVCEPSPQVLVIEFPADGGPPVIRQP